MSTITYCFSQIVVVIAYLFLGFGFQKKKKLEMLIFSTIFQALLIIHYFLFMGISGIIASTIALLRNCLFIYNEKKNKNNPIWILALFGIVTILLTIFFYKTIADLFPCILTLVGIYSYWSKNTKTLRIGNLLISICYIIYGFSLNSYLSIFCEFYIIINTIVGYFKHEYPNKNIKKIVVK